MPKQTDDTGLPDPETLLSCYASNLNSFAAVRPMISAFSSSVSEVDAKI
jgi:hypothetical protein